MARMRMHMLMHNGVWGRVDLYVLVRWCHSSRAPVCPSSVWTFVRRPARDRPCVRTDISIYIEFASRLLSHNVAFRSRSRCCSTLSYASFVLPAIYDAPWLAPGRRHLASESPLFTKCHSHILPASCGVTDFYFSGRPAASSVRGLSAGASWGELRPSSPPPLGTAAHPPVRLCSQRARLQDPLHTTRQQGGGSQQLPRVS